MSTSKNNLRFAFVVVLGLVAGAMVASPVMQPGAAHAQTKKRNPAKAQKVFKEGQKYFEEGKYQEAAVRFLNAFELDPHPVIMYNVARAHEELGQLVKALQYYRTAIGLKPSPAVEREIVAKIKDVEIYLRAQGVDVLDLENARWVPTATVTIKSEPDGATVVINGQKVGETPVVNYQIPQGILTVEVRRLGYATAVREVTAVAGKTYTFSPKLSLEDKPDGPPKKYGFLEITAPERGLTVFIDDVPDYTTPTGTIELEVGTHTITIEGDNFATWESRVTITEGQVSRLNATEPVKIQVEDKSEPLVTWSEWGWVSLISGGVLVATGSVFGAIALSEAGAYNDDRGAVGRADRRDNALTNALIADIFLGAGLVGLTVGSLIFAFTDDEVPSGEGGYDQLVRSPVRLVPLVTPSVAGGALSVGF